MLFFFLLVYVSMNTNLVISPATSYVVGSHPTVDTEVGYYGELPYGGSVTLLKTVGNIFVFVQDGNNLIVASSMGQIITPCNKEIQKTYISPDYVVVIYANYSLEVFSILLEEKKVGIYYLE